MKGFWFGENYGNWIQKTRTQASHSEQGCTDYWMLPVLVSLYAHTEVL